MSQSDARELQNRRLQEIAAFAYKSSLFYKKLFKQHKIDIRNIKCIEDLKELPFTCPQDLIQYPLEFRTSDDSVSIIYCSGGTIGQPKILFYTREDLETIHNAIAGMLFMCGIRPSDTIALMQPFGIYFIGDSHSEGYRRIGAKIIPIGIYINDRYAVHLIKYLQATVIDTCPSLLYRITNEAMDQGLDPSGDFNVKRILLAGESIKDQQRTFFTNKWNANVFNIYGSAETSIIATECFMHNGLHFFQDRLIAEVLDPVSNEPVKYGETGELVLTTLTHHGTPLLRYRIGDLVRFIGDRCKCGRTYPLLLVEGRLDEVLTLSYGIKFYAYQIDRAFQDFRDQLQEYQVVCDYEKGKDVVLFVVESTESADKNELKKNVLEAIDNISIDFVEAIDGKSIDVDVKVVKPMTIPRTERGKIVRFVDRRTHTGERK